MSTILDNDDLPDLDELDYINQDLFDTYCSTCTDLFKQNLQDRGLVEPLRRIILVGKCDYAKRNEIKQAHNEMVKNVQKYIIDKSSKVSGLMILQKSHFYHIAESSDEVLHEVIEGTAKLVKDKLIFGAKVIRSLSATIRYFDSWNSCIIMTPDYKSIMQSSEILEESEVPALAQMIQKFEDVLFVIAAHVRFIRSNLEDKLNELVPTSVLPYSKELDRLYNEPFFLTVEEYIENYLKPHDYTSYIEQEWPPTGPVHDAKDFFEELDEFERLIDEDLKIEEKKKRKTTKFGSWWWSS